MASTPPLAAPCGTWPTNRAPNLVARGDVGSTRRAGPGSGALGTGQVGRRQRGHPPPAAVTISTVSARPLISATLPSGLPIPVTVTRHRGGGEITKPYGSHSHGKAGPG
jgi:hypothetical protein